MTMKQLPIQVKITILSFGVVLFTLLISSIFLIGNVENLKKEELRKRSMITARTVAQLPEIKQNITLKDGWKNINPVVDKIRIINDADYIVVLNNLRKRYSHPNHSMIGTYSSGEDENEAFARHSYTTLAKGEEGLAVRALVPILNNESEQVGVVIVGNLLPRFSALLLDMKKEILIMLFLTLLFGISGSGLLARHIKKQMYHLEPYELKRILEERTATFNAMHEGVIAIDTEKRITVFNHKAKEMLGVSGDVIGQPIQSILYDTRLPEILELERPIFNQELTVNDTNLMSNRVPILFNHNVLGAVAIFQDRTEVTKIAEELTGVKAFVEALRVQNHEHMNKLHTIAGLIQLGNRDKALNYVFNITEEHEDLSSFLSENIGNDSLAGLLLSKVSRGKELGVQVHIDRKSHLNTFPPDLDKHDFVLLFGNLFENAFTALQQTEDPEKYIEVSIEQDEEVCSILVEDNGVGISEENQKEIFKEGFTTKSEEGHGIGLSLVKNIVDKGDGTIHIYSQPNQGTSFVITFPMDRKGST